MFEKLINKTIVDLKLGNTIITHETAAVISVSILDFLLFNRNQIPFVYEIFENMVNTLEKTKTTNTVDVKNYAIERQRDVAILTRNKINEMRRVSETNSILTISTCWFVAFFKGHFQDIPEIWN